MNTEDPGHGFIPPRWARDDFTLWEVGWAREKRAGMREALQERRKKLHPDEDRNAEAQLNRFEAEREDNDGYQRYRN
jgi:hypothetical protein